MNRSDFQAALWSLFREYEGTSARRPSSDISTADCHLKLSREDIRNAVILVTRFLGIDGAGREFDLYKLFWAYLQDLSTRAAVNELLFTERWEVE